MAAAFPSHGVPGTKMSGKAIKILLYYLIKSFLCCFIGGRKLFQDNKFFKNGKYHFKSKISIL